MKAPNLAKRAIGNLARKWTDGLPARFFDTLTPDSFAPAVSGAYGYAGMPPTTNLWRYLNAAQNSVVAAAIRLYVNNIETVRFGVVPEGNLDAEPDFMHPAMVMLNAPGPTQTRGERLWRIVEGMLVIGNALIVYEPEGWIHIPDPRYVRWPLPSALSVTYDVRDPHKPGVMKRYTPDEVAHIKHHLSPDGVNGQGVITLDVLAEIGTDQAAQNYTHTLMTRMGVSGMVFMPPVNAREDLYTRQDADAIMRMGREIFSAGGVGKWLGFDKRYDIYEPKGANAQRIDLSSIRNVSEERILSAFGIPPSLLGIGTGASQGRVGATMTANRRQFAQGSLQPLAHKIAEQLTAELLPFTGQGMGFRVVPDFTDCLPVQEAQVQLDTERAEVAMRMMQAKIWTAQEAAGLPEIGNPHPGHKPKTRAGEHADQRATAKTR